MNPYSLMIKDLKSEEEEEEEEVVDEKTKADRKIEINIGM